MNRSIKYRDIGEDDKAHEERFGELLDTLDRWEKYSEDAFQEQVDVWNAVNAYLRGRHYKDVNWGRALHTEGNDWQFYPHVSYALMLLNFETANIFTRGRRWYVSPIESIDADLPWLSGQAPMPVGEEAPPPQAVQGAQYVQRLQAQHGEQMLSSSPTRTLGRLINAYTAAVREDQELDLEFHEAGLTAFWYGTAFSRVGWNQYAFNGKGAPEVRVEDTLLCRWDTLAQSEKDLTWFRVRRFMTAAEIKREYGYDCDGHSTARVRELQHREPSPEIVENGAASSTLEDYANGRTQDGPQTVAEDMFAIDECWTLDISTEAEVQVLPDGQEVKTGRNVPKYPGGWRLTVRPVDNPRVVLQDGPSPDGFFPYTMLSIMKPPASTVGQGLARDLVTLNQSSEQLLKRTLDNYAMVADTDIEVHVDGLQNRDKLNTPAPGRILLFKGGRQEAIRKVPPPDVSSQGMRLFSALTEVMDSTSGIGRQSRGEEPRERFSGKAIESLQQAVQTLIRYNEKFIDNFLERTGRKFVDLVIMRVNWEDTRLLKIPGGEQAPMPINLSLATLQGTPWSLRFTVKVQADSHKPLNPEARHSYFQSMWKEIMGIFQAHGIEAVHLYLDMIEADDRDYLKDRFAKALKAPPPPPPPPDPLDEALGKGSAEAVRRLVADLVAQRLMPELATAIDAPRPPAPGPGGAPGQPGPAGGPPMDGPPMPPMGGPPMPPPPNIEPSEEELRDIPIGAE